MNYKQRNISSETSLLEALKKMDELDKKLLLVKKENKFIGLLSAGDIQRAIIQNKSLDTCVSEVLRKNIRVAIPNDSFEYIKQMMMDYRMEFCPVVDNKKEIIKIHYWEDIFQELEPKPNKLFNLPVVIMAGGKGSRLKPITNVLPKPLIPIGEKSIIEEIFDRFEIYGCQNFFISVNYKADFIEYYLKKQNISSALNFFKEKKPMGTAGSLSLLKNTLKETFFVSNCDIIIEQDYGEILAYHKENNNEITIVAALKHFSLPYGIVETGDNGCLLGLKEKPELTFKINSGMYILEPHLLEEIPENKFFHITQLIENIVKRKGRVGVFPVSEGSWKDIGDWNEYLKEI